jgi:hypothetical protein
MSPGDPRGPLPRQARVRPVGEERIRPQRHALAVGHWLQISTELRGELSPGAPRSAAGTPAHHAPTRHDPRRGARRDCLSLPGRKARSGRVPRGRQSGGGPPPDGGQGVRGLPRDDRRPRVARHGGARARRGGETNGRRPGSRPALRPRQVPPGGARVVDPRPGRHQGRHLHAEGRAQRGRGAGHRRLSADDPARLCRPPHPSSASRCSSGA